MKVKLGSVSLPRLKGLSLVSGGRFINSLAHEWMARWAVTQPLHVMDCNGSFEPLRVLHTLEDLGLDAPAVLENISVHRVLTPLEFMAASRRLRDESRPVIVLGPLSHWPGLKTSAPASRLWLDGFLSALYAASQTRRKVLLVQPGSADIAPLCTACDRTWLITRQGVQSIAGLCHGKRSVFAAHEMESRIRAAI